MISMAIMTLAMEGFIFKSEKYWPAAAEINMIIGCGVQESAFMENGSGFPWRSLF
jgi:hypothetical protein